MKRVIKNLIGRLTGHEKCVFCGDRKNWKQWMETINICIPTDGVTNNEYTPPVCNDCLRAQTSEAILHAVNADLSEYNNFCRSFGAKDCYSDAEQDIILKQVFLAKNTIAGLGGTVNSN